MQSGKKICFVPKCRFPQFQGSDGWIFSLLGATCDMQAGKFVAAAEIYAQSGADLFPCYGGNGLRGYTKSHTHSGRYSLIGRQGALCGNVNLVDGSFHATEHAVVATPKTGIHTEWLFYELDLLNLNRFATGQAQPGLSVDVLNKVECAIPKDEDEQKKIADCLSSIDELVVLVAQKLEILKNNKKGLMQQLFPAEGEILPKRRFHEFLDAEPWSTDQLGVVAEFINEKISVDRVALENYISTESILSDYDGITKASKLPEIGSVTRFRSTDTLVSNIRPYLKKIWYADKEGGASNDVIVIRAKQGLLAEYLSYLLKNDSFIEYVMIGAKGVKMPRGDIDQIKQYPVPVPSKDEQQKIAKCLRDLDDLIAAQGQNLHALKAHKKGLMHQLFPAMSEEHE